MLAHNDWIVPKESYASMAARDTIKRKGEKERKKKVYLIGNYLHKYSCLDDDCKRKWEKCGRYVRVVAMDQNTISSSSSSFVLSCLLKCVHFM